MTPERRVLTDRLCELAETFERFDPNVPASWGETIRRVAQMPAADVVREAVRELER